MTFARQRLSHILPFALFAGVALVPGGCGNDEGVSKAHVPKTTEPALRAASEAAGEYRMLGLMLPADNPEWFFKYSGPADEIAKYAADFDKLAASVQLVGGAPDYTPPEGWEKGPGREGFVKVFGTVKTTDGKQEISITQSGGGVQTNLDRWVGQIGLKPGADDREKYTKVIDGKGVKVLRVDLQGPKNPLTNRAPFAGGAMPPGHP
jgi:hypothetical protein